MSVENILVELTAPATGAGVAESMLRVMQVTAAAGTAVVDGVTYTRTSPLRTQMPISPGMGGKLTDYTDVDASQPPVASSPSQGTTPLPIFSASGT